MSNYIPRPRRRRIAFAAPFILTIAGACGGGQKTGDNGCPKGASCNPPPPDMLQPAPAGHGDWKDDGAGGWTAAYPDGGILRRTAEGACSLVMPSGPCPENAACNPPPPQDVQCPADSPPAPETPVTPPTP